MVVVADLSRSMPAESRARALEIIRLLEQRRATGDRVGIVTFGREARIERLPEEFSEAADFVQEVDRDGSDLGGAIGLAASLIPRGRPGRVIVLSDGEANGASVMAAAHEAASRGLPVDFRSFSRGDAADIAVESLDAPGMVDEREPFQFTASVRTDRTVESEAVLFRDGVEVARTTRTFQPGSTQLTFRDLIDRPGVSRYRLELAAAGDRVPENNLGEGAIRVQAPATILLVNATGGPDNLSRALGAGKLRVHTIAASSLPKDLAGLLAYRAVILENVPADQVGPQALAGLARFATDLGGGLLLTGGAGSFGVGGYFKSVLDPHLPVSMELQNEHRKLSLAMAVALDRSGSMAVPAGAGRTKMDLANLGTCAAIDTLGPHDEVGVIAVDSAPHIISPLTSAKDKDQICDQVRRIQSMGGGIFTYTALVTAAKMVQESNKGTRHIVLFADAADAEEPGDYQRLLQTLTSIGITTSVIGLGSETDSDAEFLKDVAARGQGRIHFTADVEDLPRLFAQEAITAARSSFITEPTAARTLPDMVLLGEPSGVAVSRHRRLQPHVPPAGRDDGRGHGRRLQGAGAGLLVPRPRAHRVAHGRSGRSVLAATECVAGLPGICHRHRPLAARRRAARRGAGHARTPGRRGYRPRRTRSRPHARRRRRSADRERDDRRAGRSAERPVAAPRPGVGRRRHTGSTVPGAEIGHVPGRRQAGHRRRAAVGAAEPAVLAGVRAADRFEGRTAGR